MPSTSIGSGSNVKGANVGLVGSSMAKGSSGSAASAWPARTGGGGAIASTSTLEAANKARRKSSATISTIQLSTATLGSFKPMEGALIEGKAKHQQHQQSKAKSIDPFEEEFPSLAANPIPKSSGLSISASALQKPSVDWAAKVTSSSAQPAASRKVGEGKPSTASDRPFDFASANSDQEELERLRFLVPKLQTAPKSGSIKTSRIKMNKLGTITQASKPINSSTRPSSSVAPVASNRGPAVVGKASSSPPPGSMQNPKSPGILLSQPSQTQAGIVKGLRSGKQFSKERQKRQVDMAIPQDPSETYDLKHIKIEKPVAARENSKLQETLLLSSKSHNAESKTSAGDDCTAELVTDSLTARLDKIHIGVASSEKEWTPDASVPRSASVKFEVSKPPPENWEDEVESPLLHASVTIATGPQGVLENHPDMPLPEAQMDELQSYPKENDHEPLSVLASPPTRAPNHATPVALDIDNLIPYGYVSDGGVSPSEITAADNLSPFDFLTTTASSINENSSYHSSSNNGKTRSLSEAFSSKLPSTSHFQRHDLQPIYSEHASFFGEAPSFPMDSTRSFVPSVMADTYDSLNPRMRTMSSPAISFTKPQPASISPRLGAYWATDLERDSSSELLIPSLVSPAPYYTDRNSLLNSQETAEERQGEYVMTEEEKLAFWNGVGRGLGGDEEDEADDMLSFRTDHRTLTGSAMSDYPTHPHYSDGAGPTYSSYANGSMSLVGHTLSSLGYISERGSESLGGMSMHGMSQPAAINASVYQAEMSLNPSTGQHMGLLEADLMAQGSDPYSHRGSLATSSLAFFHNPSSINSTHHHHHHHHRASIPSPGLFSPVGNFAASGMPHEIGYDFSHTRRSSAAALKSYASELLQ
ncbi:hypothetical protein HDU67_007731 [Dinochytrium kinnereticum]|nr:hypothetical protein HDU67_007731 [Dinochytrium kinnereticum]